MVKISFSFNSLLTYWRGSNASYYLNYSCYWIIWAFEDVSNPIGYLKDTWFLNELFSGFIMEFLFIFIILFNYCEIYLLFIYKKLNGKFKYLRKKIRKWWNWIKWRFRWLYWKLVK